jgi:hypothetical protein
MTTRFNNIIHFVVSTLSLVTPGHSHGLSERL